MDSITCPICLEHFQEDAAYIPDDLNCDCTLIVHWECWEPWSGDCLYCRNTVADNRQNNLNIIQYIIIHQERNVCFYVLLFVWIVMYIIVIVYNVTHPSTDKDV